VAKSPPDVKAHDVHPEKTGQEEEVHRKSWKNSGMYKKVSARKLTF
jgi:hypothetical protein